MGGTLLTVLAGEAPAPSDPGGFNGTLARWAENFIGVFQRGAETFTGLVVGIIPLLIVLLTAVNALIRLIGVERIDKVGELAARPGLQYLPVRYLLLPVLAVFFLTNPMAYTMGRFLPEDKKPAFYDSADPAAPRVIALDEVFAGIDRPTRGKLMGLLAEFDLDFIMTSYEEWGFYEELDGLSTYHLSRERGMHGVHTDWFLWDGRTAVPMETATPRA